MRRMQVMAGGREPLTSREQAVLSGLLTGGSTDDIAHELSISRSTVKCHLRNIYGKLGASGKRDAVRIARESALVPLEAARG
ncbi:response regulator transcription factor [Solimonas sp. SE-A11]|uniref:response regulator transcription factor n=1 Tax=Solimonas sp. SE-A11 TaxID=3054954 RepID=UPI00259C977E|nr:helix-turn-helix transcriptional regulator [Solimonas sp. SE-A11]MDM4769493.1 helix-turn-helix transcriptional regulator [Solimonas sp. SE-A11]